MRQPRALAVARERVEQAVDVARGLRAALHGEPRGLVERDHVVVLVEHERGQKGLVAARRGRAGSGLFGVRQRRHADALAGFEPRVGLRAAAVDADLARAQELLQRAVGDVREAPLEPAVEPRARLAGCDLDDLHAAHVNALRAMSRPSTSAPTAPATESAT